MKVLATVAVIAYFSIAKMAAEVTSTDKTNVKPISKLDLVNFNAALQCINNTITGMQDVVHGIGSANIKGMTSDDKLNAQIFHKVFKLAKQYLESKKENDEHVEKTGGLRHARAVDDDLTEKQYDDVQDILGKAFHLAQNAKLQRQVDAATKPLQTICSKFEKKKGRLDKLYNDLVESIKEPCKQINETLMQAIQEHPVSSFHVDSKCLFSSLQFSTANIFLLD